MSSNNIDPLQMNLKQEFDISLFIYLINIY